MDAAEARERFVALAAGSDDRIDLLEGALLISAEEQGDLDPAATVARLDTWAADLGRSMPAAGDLPRLERLCSFLYEEKGLEGNRDEYYDPRNSFVDQVLERRQGIPISLAVVLLELGRRVRVPLQGVGLPGHFLVRHGLHPEILVDPFGGGRLLTQADCARILERVSRGRIEYSRGLLRPVGPRQILLRMLNNLCGIYVSRGCLDRSLSVLDRILLLDPEEPLHRRNRGLLRARAGDADGALEDFEAYLEAAPDAPDWDAVAAAAEEVREHRSEVC